LRIKVKVINVQILKFCIKDYYYLILKPNFISPVKLLPESIFN
jgi:hypothetical protein